MRTVAALLGRGTHVDEHVKSVITKRASRGRIQIIRRIITTLIASRCIQANIAISDSRTQYKLTDQGSINIITRLTYCALT